MALSSGGHIQRLFQLQGGINCSLKMLISLHWLHREPVEVHHCWVSTIKVKGGNKDDNLQWMVDSGQITVAFGSKVVLSPTSQGLVNPGCCPAEGWLGFLWRMAEAGAWPWLAAPYHLHSLGKVGVAILLYSSPQPFLPPHITHFCKAPAGLPSRKTHTVRFVRISYFRLILDDLYDEYFSVLALWLLV